MPDTPRNSGGDSGRHSPETPHSPTTQGAEQAAAIIVAAGREADLPPSWQMHDAGRGHRCIVVDELWARSLCAVEHIELCPAFNGALSPGEVWCLVLTPEGGLVVPALPTTGLGRARSRGPAN